MVRSLAIAALLLLESISHARADEWSPWPNQRVVSKSGEYYVVMKRVEGKRFFNEWGPVEFWIAKRRPGSAPVRSAVADIVELGSDDWQRGGTLYEVQQDEEVRVRKGDVVLGWGMIDRPPRDLYVFSNGRGFLGLDVYAYNFNSDPTEQRLLPAIRVFNTKGTVVRRLYLSDLFDQGERARLFTGTNWLRAYWINEAKAQLTIKTGYFEYGPATPLLRSINMDSGKP